ncbi:MAG: GAF domain-containing SpoIIE family protein phosphatase, partial [bacterium]
KYQTREQRRLLMPFKITAVCVGISLVVFGRLNLPGTTVATFLSILVPLSLLYSITRYRLFDLNLRVRKNVQFSFASAVWTMALVCVFIWLLFLLPRQTLMLPNIHLTGASIEVLPTALQPREQTIAEKTFLMLAAIALAFLFLRIGKAGYNFLATKFYRGGYDYRRAAHRIAEVLSSTLNMEDLARGIAEKLSEMMSLKRVGVMFFRNQQTCCCDVAHGFDGDKWREFCFSQQNTMAEWLKPHTKEFSVDSLPAAVRSVFRSQEIQIVVPIRSKDKLIGALLIGEKRSETAFHQEDYEFLSATAKQASVAVENSFLYEGLAEQERMKHELGIARQIQLSSLPQITPNIPGLEIAGMSIPAFEVGGDYFDYLNGETGKLTVIVGDVSGKGTSAALYMSKVQGILHSLHSFGLSPRDLFIRTNTVLCNDLSQKAFVTAFGAAFNVQSKTINLARAGHLPLYHFDSSTKKILRIIPKGLGMGMSPETTFSENLEEQTIRYNAGDVFVFVTDGITEGRAISNEEYGDDRLVALFNDNVHASASEIRDRILAAVKEFAGDAQQHDDQTVVVVKAV